MITRAQVKIDKDTTVEVEFDFVAEGMRDEYEILGYDLVKGSLGDVLSWIEDRLARNPNDSINDFFEAELRKLRALVWQEVA